MYEELVNQLRHPWQYNGLIAELTDSAADAIEELNLIAESNRRNAKAWADTAEKAAEQIPRWIPVTERPPDVKETILDTTFSVDVIGFDGWNCRRAYYNYTDKVWLNGNDEDEWPEITHWMPMPKDGFPEPPKEAV